MRLAALVRGRHEPRTVAKPLMNTGLTFGTISSLYGLNAHIIDRTPPQLCPSAAPLA
jgi:hypothetical protein